MLLWCLFDTTIYGMIYLLFYILAGLFTALCARIFLEKEPMHIGFWLYVTLLWPSLWLAMGILWLEELTRSWRF